MKRRQAYKFELMANACQEHDARRFAGACRFVFNKALMLQQQNFKDGGKFIQYEELARHLIEWKKDPLTSWLQMAPSQALTLPRFHVQQKSIKATLNKPAFIRLRSLYR